MGWVDTGRYVYALGGGSTVDLLAPVSLAATALILLTPEISDWYDPPLRAERLEILENDS